jgi:hypothetical protein
LNFEALGQQILDRKEELKEDGIPADAEHVMVRKAHGRPDTPATAAHARRSSVKSDAHEQHVRRSKFYGNKIIAFAFELAERLQGQAQDSQGYEGAERGKVKIQRREESEKP